MAANLLKNPGSISDYFKGVVGARKEREADTLERSLLPTSFVRPDAPLERVVSNLKGRARQFTDRGLGESAPGKRAQERFTVANEAFIKRQASDKLSTFKRELTILSMGRTIKGSKIFSGKMPTKEEAKEALRTLAGKDEDILTVLVRLAAQQGKGESPSDGAVPSTPEVGNAIGDAWDALMKFLGF